MRQPLSIVHVASEMAPLAKVGGLADVIGALAFAQARRGHRVLVVLPAYRDLVVPEDWVTRSACGCDVPWGMGKEPAEFDLCSPRAGGPSVLLVRYIGERRLFDRAGLYDDPETGEGYVWLG